MLYYDCFKTLLYMLRMDFSLFFKTFYDKAIDVAIWVGTMIIVVHYIMPSFGLTLQYTGIMVGGLCGSVGIFEVWPRVMELVTDFTGPKTINYYMTLPIPSWLVFVRFAVFYATCGSLLAVGVLPLAKLLVFHDFPLANFSSVKFVLMVVASNLFYGAFIVLISSFVQRVDRLGMVWVRFIYPLWFFGGFQFTWHALHKIAPLFAYINLINPVTYVMEGMRASLLGQDNFIPVWLCVTVLLLCTVLCLSVGIIRLKKRFDYV